MFLAKESKYQWEIGGKLPELDEHSHIKHAIIADYIKRYVKVYMSNANIETLPLTIVDGFAGGGRYKDALTTSEIEGSPFLILNAVKEAEVTLNIDRVKPRRIDAEYHFVEKDNNNFDFLKYELNFSEFFIHLGSKIFLHRSEFGDVSPEIVERIQKRNRAQRALFILDQYAYKDVPLRLVRHILKTVANSEVIMTFNYDSLQRYISDTLSNRKALENIDIAEHINWKRFAQLKEAGLWQSAIQEQLANAIWKASGARHMTLFFVTSKKGSSYWLVHLSKVYRARDVMMDLHYKHSNDIDYIFLTT